MRPIHALLKAKRFFDGKDFESSIKIARSVWLKSNGMPKAHAAHLLMINYISVGDLVKAKAFYHNAYPLLNIDAAFLTNAATLRLKEKQYDHAKELCYQALRVKPNCADAFFILGTILDEQGEHECAIGEYQLGLRIDERPQIHTNIGNSLEALGQREEAKAEHIKAMNGVPDAVEPYLNIASIAMKERDYPYCLSLYEQVLRIDPRNGPAKMGMAQIDLMHGRWVEGWFNYAWRFHAQGTVRSYPWPQWKGFDELDPRLRLLVVFEQGYGDSFMAARFLPALQQIFGDNLVLNCPKDLQKIIDCAHVYGHAPQAFQYLGDVSTSKLKKSFDRYIHLMDLFRVFDDAFEKQFGSYIESNPFDRITRNLHFGFCWRGRNIPDPKRTIPWDQFVHILPGNIQKVKLQQDAQIRETLAFNIGINDRTNWIDTARTIAMCDLIVTIDTSIAHLAGALGKETWVLVPYSADWRWGDPAKGSIRPAPFYPNMTVFQQTRENDWSETLKVVNERLSERAVVNVPIRNKL